MSVKQLKQILAEYLKGSNYNEINNTVSIQVLWEKMVGKPISQNTELEAFINGIIKIKVSNPVWRNELSLQKQSLLEKLKMTEPSLNIKDIILK